MSSLFVISAREAPVAVVLRRGPSKQVLLLKWNLTTDKLQPGQWFKGRIYERRCDLSPSGDLLIYFGAKFKPPFYSWTAISRPPYFSALALWPKGDTWGGGGVFDKDHSVRLNHSPGQDDLAPDFSLPSNLKIAQFGQYAGHGEDFPIHHFLLERNGWKYCGRTTMDSPTPHCAYPIVYEKKIDTGLTLQMQMRGSGKSGGTRYRTDHIIFDSEGNELFKLPGTNWADWHDRHLLFAKGCRLFRLRKDRFSQYLNHGDRALKLVADLSSLKFEEQAPPHKAMLW
ncbi:hypothetical protein ACQR1W_39220 [Bradyrhizobium sp. HKCCYLS1011]|uniref:hypothetical protein n=1 Tax=Bradyrhizobium sp. HKCCYLS1011 TaxID=3420733 RepID=UPI003EBFB30D